MLLEPAHRESNELLANPVHSRHLHSFIFFCFQHPDILIVLSELAPEPNRAHLCFMNKMLFEHSHMRVYATFLLYIVTETCSYISTHSPTKPTIPMIWHPLKKKATDPSNKLLYQVFVVHKSNWKSYLKHRFFGSCQPGTLESARLGETWEAAFLTSIQVTLTLPAWEARLSGTTLTICSNPTVLKP